MMKRKIMIVVLCIFAASLLTACATTETEGQPTSAITATADIGETPLSTQLLLGSFELENSELAISTEQASELLSLWKAVKVLSESDTASPLELEAVYNQIQAVMTDEQLAAIADLTLDGESMATLMSDLGLGMGSGAGMERDDASGDTPQRPDDMGSIEGLSGDGAGGDMQMVAESMDDEDREAAMAERSNMMEENMLLALVDPMIELLQERVA
jgi:predicted small secreted protein